MVNIIDEFGLQGYARYWILIETIAEKWKPEDSKEVPSVSYPWNIWAKLLKLKRNKLLLFVRRLEYLGIIKAEHNENIIKIFSQKLLEIKDRDFGRARHGRAQSAGATRQEEEKELEEEEETPYSPPSGANGIGPEAILLEKIYRENFPNAIIGREKSVAHFRNLVETYPDLGMGFLESQIRSMRAKGFKPDTNVWVVVDYLKPKNKQEIDF